MPFSQSSYICSATLCRIPHPNSIDFSSKQRTFSADIIFFIFSMEHSFQKPWVFLLHLPLTIQSLKIPYKTSFAKIWVCGGCRRRGVPQGYCYHGVRPEKELNAIEQLQRAYGDKYRPLAMLDSKRKASGLLHEYADEQAVQKLKRAQQQKIQSEHTPPQSKKKRIDFER